VNAMDATTEILVAGRPLRVPSANLFGWPVIVTGRWVRLAQLKHEELLEGDASNDAPRIIAALQDRALRADLFTFRQRLPDGVPRHSHYFEWEHWAGIRTTSFLDWWTSLPQESRKNVRRAAKRGVVVGTTVFDDELVEGIRQIYNETPVRQGRRFWHYGKDFDTVKKEIGTYLERSDFLAARLGDELIGFIKLTYVNRAATITQILAKNAHHDARPMNALLAAAVQLSHTKNMEFLIYGQYIYGRHTQSLLTEFKRRNGFQEITLPRYFVPLTMKGELALKCGLHSNFRDRLPSPFINLLLGLRSRLRRPL
jgi:hypothetical protein